MQRDRSRVPTGFYSGAGIRDSTRASRSTSVSRARSISREQDVEQAQSRIASGPFERKQPASGDDTVMWRNLVEIGADVEHAVARYDQGKSISRLCIGDRMQRSRVIQMRRDLLVAPSLSARDAANVVVDPPIDRRDVAHVEGDIGQVAILTAQHGNDPVNSALDLRRGPQFACFGKQPEQAPERLDLSRFRQLYSGHTCIAPCNAATADCRIENGIPTPHDATPTTLCDSNASSCRTAVTQLL